MNKEELIGKLHMIYAGDRNALEEMVGYYDGLKQGIEIVQQENKHLKEKVNQLETNRDKAIEYIENNTCWDLRTSKVLEILKEVE